MCFIHNIYVYTVPGKSPFFFFLSQKKRIVGKEPVKGTAILGHVNKPIKNFAKGSI